MTIRAVYEIPDYTVTFDVEIKPETAFTGDIYVNAGNVVLEGFTDDNDVIIGSAVKDSDIYFENCKIGNMTVSGAGSNSVHLTSSTTIGALTVSKGVAAGSQSVRVAVDDTSTIETLTANYALKIEGENGETVKNEITSITLSDSRPAQSSVQINANAAALDVNATAVSIGLHGTVKNLNISDGVRGSVVTGDGNINTAFVPDAAKKNGFSLAAETESVLSDIVAYYSITVNGGSADKPTAAEGETVTLTADPAPTGKIFDKWTSEQIQISDNTFIIPAEDVTITAAW